MAISTYYVKLYANQVYLQGTRRLNDRGDGSTILLVPTSPDDYRPAVMQYANTNYDMINMNYALSQGYITQQEYDDTLALGPMKPGSMPAAPLAN